MPRPEVRFDRHGKLTCLAAAKGYRMARRPRGYPYVLTEKEWQALPADEWTAEMIEAHDTEEERRTAGMRAVMQFLTTGKMPEGATVKVQRVSHSD